MHTCIYCNISFVPQPKSRGLYCSLSCSNKDRIRKNEAVYLQNPKPCKQCSGPIPYLKKNAIFCSRSCGAKHNNALRSTESRNKQHLSILEKYNSSHNLEKRKYYLQSGFAFPQTEFPKLPGYDILVERKMYHKDHNPDGVVRDHMFSICEGYKQGVDPILLSHPANCAFIPHKDNGRKSSRCSITLEELKFRISNWS